MKRPNAEPNDAPWQEFTAAMRRLVRVPKSEVESWPLRRAPEKRSEREL
jgi:hypothetical protein